MKLHLWIVLLLCAAVCGQTTPPIPPPAPAPQQSKHPPVAPPPSVQQPAPPRAPADTGSGSSAEAPDKTAKPQTKITAEQAQELFRSVDEILQFVSEDTGLAIKHPVKRQLADRNQVESYIQERMKDDEDAKRLERSSLVLKKFGLVPRDFDLQRFLLALLKEQVAGYYDSKTKTVYLLDWVEPEQQKPVLAHELTHALQDQNFGLEQLSKSAKKNDPTGLEADERLAARQAMIEGQGMLVLMDYMLAPMGSSVRKQPELVDAMQAGLTATGANMAVFNRAPMFLQQVLLFPYRFGTLFERDVLVKAGKQKAFADTLKNPPADTRQVMQPATYLEGQLVPPLKPLDFDKLAREYKKWDLSVMGEFDVFLLLHQYASVEVAKDLSKQWRGGYYWAGRTSKAPKEDAALTTGDLAVVYVSRWANEHAAGQFAGAYSEALSKRYPGARQVGGTVTPKLQEAPGTGIQITISPILTGPVTWETSEGQVTIEPRGDTVLVMESFDSQTAKTIREAVLQ
jgi:hypothetical protein